jgi:hypothetical protein
MQTIPRVLIIVACWGMVGCGNSVVVNPDGQLACAGDEDCQAGFRCDNGACVERPVCTDFDGDGYCDKREGYDDCNDNRANIHPGAAEVCDGLDNDCDAEIDEDCPCNAGDSQACGTDVGNCIRGRQSCENGQWGVCQGGRPPAAVEDCEDELDNDCNGAVNDGCACAPDDTRACGSALGGCTPGVQSCVENAGDWQWGSCQGGTPPTEELCGDELDNDCDGSIDNGCECDQASRPCGLNVGICSAGTQLCREGTWSSCDGARMPEDEVCNGLDDDCDMLTDEGCECLDGQFEACGTDVGECSMGSRHCVRGRWSPCEGEVPPAAERCDGRDNDCDGQFDEDFAQLLERCSAGVGICARPGAWICSPDGSGLVCNASPGSGNAEFCNGLDDDCDGQVDEDFSGLGDPCTLGQGECFTAGVTTCDLSGGYQCNAQVILPGPERCDDLDNNCDGQTDEIFPKGLACGAGIGQCYTTGTWVCSPDGSEAVCNATPPAGAAETCDGLDNDCDGEIDELLSQPCSTQCGSGFRICISGVYGACSAPQPQNELCNGLDDDCDGSTDEGFANLGQACQIGTGACLSRGYYVCNADGSGTRCNAVAGTAQTESDSANYTCQDGIDNDCDGQVDGNDGDCSSGCRNLSLQDLYPLQGLLGGLGLIMFRRRRRSKAAAGPKGGRA